MSYVIGSIRLFYLTQLKNDLDYKIMLIAEAKADMSKSKICHEHPATLSEKAEKIKQKVLTKKSENKIDPERTRFFCLNNGCNNTTNMYYYIFCPIYN